MKRLFIVMLLLTSFSLACDGPYEDIQGVKIGCEFTGGDGFKTYKTKSIGENFYTSNKGIKFFDSMEVETDKNNKVIGVAFIKKYPITMSNMEIQEKKIIESFKQFAESLENRWGKFNKSNAKNIYSILKVDGAMFMLDVEEKITNKKPKSDAVGGVLLMLKFNTDSKSFLSDKAQEATLSLMYFGKSTAEAIQKEQESVTDGF